ncbi:MAG: adenylate kinase [Deltaproteobacteria bacterium]|nr:adenylate kinase [Deltaproteobacteria bacterium]
MKQEVPIRLVLVGSPGSGKGTQGKLIEKKYGIPHLAAGDILRQEVARGSELGRQAKVVMDRGELLADAIITSVIEARLEESDCRRGWILDGFPRTIGQAKALERWLAQRGENLTAVVAFELPDAEILKRLMGRLTSSVTKRVDDDPAVHQKRIDIYRRETAPIFGFYEGKKLLVKIDATGTVDEVSRRIVAAVKT